MARRLSAEERALWAKVIETVRPIGAARLEMEALSSESEQKKPIPERPAARPAPAQPKPVRPQPSATLDGTWDRRLGRGLVQPEMSVDLHGHNLATAYDLLDRRLEQAIAAEIRVLLLITGKAPKGEPPIERGRIRAAVGDWLAASRHAGSIAAVRTAHPRHGGAGALYLVLRRRR